MKAADNPDGPLTPEKAQEKSAAFERTAVPTSNSSRRHSFLQAVCCRSDLKKLTLPTLVIHGDADAIVPFEGSGYRTHSAVLHSKLVKVKGAPHGLNVSHASAFNDALLSFLRD